MGKKPFSAKAKREQLRQKRSLAANASSSTATATHATSSKQSLASATPPSSSSSPPVATPTPSLTPQRQARGRAPRGAGSHTHRYRLQLDSADRSRTSNDDGSTPGGFEIVHTPITTLALASANVEMSVDDIRPVGDLRFQMPRRPTWRYDEDVSVVDRRESEALSKWIDTVTSKQGERPPYFEHNIETWRQLWRVIERSDVIVLVVDIRYPALHFVPDLYEHVTNELSKGFVLAMNKCDLVSTQTLDAWKQYFESEYPRMAIAMFSCFPDAKLSPSQYNSDMLSKRERRMARSKLSAWGADQLLAAVYSLDAVAEEKKEYLGDWRKRMNVKNSDDFDDSDRDFHCETDDDYESTGMSTYSYGDEDSYLEAQESLNHRQRYKLAQRKRKRSNLPPEKKMSCVPSVSEELQKEGSNAGAKNWKEASKQKKNRRHFLGDGSDSEDVAVNDDMITIGIVGHPNAGKSSLINGIFRRKVVSTSKTPGHTKHLQTIFLTNRVRLCDCPGLVFPGLAARELQIIAGMFPIAQVREPIKVVKYLADRVALVDVLRLSTEVEKLEDFLLETRYVEDGWTAWKICEAWAMKRGYRTAKAARLDVARAANHILRLALDGRIVLSTVPKGFKVSSSSTSCVDVGDEEVDEKTNVDNRRSRKAVTLMDMGLDESDLEQGVDSDRNLSGENDCGGRSLHSSFSGSNSDSSSCDEDEGQGVRPARSGASITNTFALLDQDVE